MRPNMDDLVLVLCERCGVVLTPSSRATLVLVGDEVVLRFCCLQHAAEALTSITEHG